MRERRRGLQDKREARHTAKKNWTSQLCKREKDWTAIKGEKRAKVKEKRSQALKPKTVKALQNRG